MPDRVADLRAALADRYRVERPLGRGGMATVYQAHDLRHDRPVALKVFHPELASILGERFVHEVRVAARLAHPHILTVHDSGEAAGLLWYTMPIVDGESLRQRLEREGQLPVAEAVRIASTVAEALDHAHVQGIVHRDIKPENILLFAGEPMVADFGIALALDRADEQRLTLTGISLGTPAYMSPEQACAAPRLDGRTDIYSLGCVLYEMLAGEPPFTGPTPQAIVSKCLTQSPQPIRTVRELPEALDQAVLTALARNPADRFMRAHDFARAVTEGAAAPRGDLSLTVPVSPRRRGGRRARVGAAVAALVALAAAAMATRRWWEPTTATSPPAAVPAADPRHIAVLYFGDRSEKQNLGFLADGLTETLIHQLSPIRPLQVISANGVEPYRNAKASPDSIGRALKVGTLVEGTVAGSRDRLRVSVALVSATTGAELATTTLERPRSDIFALQDSLAQAVSFFLRQRLGEEVQLQESRLGTRSAAAWELVQQAAEVRKGIPQVLLTSDTAAAFREVSRADSLLERSARLDPQWAVPLVQRGWLQLSQRRYRTDRAWQDQITRRAGTLAEQALRLAPGDPDALSLRGDMRYWRYLYHLDRDSAEAARSLAGAESDLRAAVAGNPTQADAWAMLSHLLARKSEPEEARLAALRAYQADPYLSDAPVVLYRLFTSELDLEHAAEAGRWCREGAERFPDDPSFVECRILMFVLKGQRPDVAEAWRLLDQDVALYPPNQREYRRRNGQQYVAMVIARAGLLDSAKAVALRARGDTLLDPSGDLLYVEMLGRSVMGDREEALGLLERYLKINPQDRTSIAKDSTWWLRGLREDPRFKALVGGAVKRPAS